MRPLASSIKGKRAIDQMWMDWRLIQGDLALSSLSSLTRALLSTVCQTLLSLCRSCDVLSFLIPRSVLCRLSTTPGVTASLSLSRSLGVSIDSQAHASCMSASLSLALPETVARAARKESRGEGRGRLGEGVVNIACPLTPGVLLDGDRDVVVVASSVQVFGGSRW